MRIRRQSWMPCVAFALLAQMPLAALAAPAAEDAARCVDLADDAARLRCYDLALKRPAPAPAAAPSAGAIAGTRNVVFPHEPATRAVAADEHPVVRSLLDSRWELDESSKQGEFHIRAYKPVYLLPVFYTSDTNQRPSTPAPGRTVTQSRNLQAIETVYQLSLKTKLWENIFGDNGDLWTGYTQVSHWQLYNDAQSRPFSETNYEPEVMLTFRTNYDVLGWNGRLFGLAVNHQSNGRGLPLSRSWNRVMLNLGFERDGWTLMLRPWWRVHDDNDDNPDISDYIGRGDLQLVHVWNGHEFALMARHSLRGGDRSRGALQFEWAFPIAGDLRGHLQLFDGYGQSLIDYNHRAWYFGLGVSLLEWY
ncbi:phospholipase A [Dokdonella ginsengisoli]|uniref:Phospholipase A1 n=1 Tax=Dokdonella ginsengisoli TaxID=363846 RepID=A0ABV9QYJ5_9GAMM